MLKRRANRLDTVLAVNTQARMKLCLEKCEEFFCAVVVVNHISNIRIQAVTSCYVGCAEG